MKPTFSFVLIARNESKTLPKLMSSLKPFKDLGGEVVLVDTGSTDETADVARSLGCSVTEVGDRFRRTITKDEAESINKWAMDEGEGEIIKEGDTLFDFTAARNYAASLAGNDWIWMPDCDEAFTNLDLDEVERAISLTSDIGRLEYNFVFSHDEFGKAGLKFIHSKMYDRRKLTWKGVVHEVLSNLNTLPCNSKFLPEDKVLLEHWQNHETNRAGYLKGLALDCWLNQDNDRNAHYFGRELSYYGKWNSAIKMLERHINMDKWPAEKAQSMVLVGNCWGALGDGRKQDEFYFKAWLTEPSRNIGLFSLMEKYYQLQDPKRVIAYGLLLEDIPYSGFYSDIVGHYTNLPQEYLYWAYWVLGDKEKSKEHWKKALAYCPDHPKYRQDAEFYVNVSIDIIIPTLGREDGLRRCLDSITASHYQQDRINVIIKDGEGTVPEKVKEMMAQGKAEYVVFAANDMEFEPKALLESVALAEVTGKGLVAMDAGNSNECEHFLFRRSLLPKLENGELFSTDFHHVGCDNWLWAQCEKMGEAIRCPNAKVVHHHFSKGGTMDEIYHKGWSKVDEDRKILNEKLSRLNAK